MYVICILINQVSQVFITFLPLYVGGPMWLDTWSYRSLRIHTHEYTIEATFGKIYAYNVLSWSRGHCQTGEEKEKINISSFSRFFQLTHL